MQPRKFETGRLVEAVHDIERLHRLARGTLHQVVDGADDHQTVRIPVALESDVAVVRPTTSFGSG